MLNKQIADASLPGGETLKQTLTVCAAIAEIIGMVVYLATLISQDSLLVLSMAVIIILFTVALFGLMRSNLFKRIGVGLVVIVLVLSIAAAAIAWSWLTTKSIKPVEITIADPHNDGAVTMRYLIQGSVSNPHSRVYVMVHPLTVPEMWVQNPPVVGADGSWQTYAYFGTTTLGLGDQYEVVAIASDENFLVTLATGNYLKEGQIIQNLPRNTNRSEVVTVQRSE